MNSSTSSTSPISSTPSAILAIESSCDAKSRSLNSGKSCFPEADDADFSNSRSELATTILAIESSCDETAAAIYDLTSEKLLSSVVVSQIDIFKAYGGVIPEVAARSHLEAILPVIDQAFAKAGFLIEPTPSSMNRPTPPTTQCHASSSTNHSQSQCNDWSRISAIAVTHTPGLLGSLLVGTLTARTLALLHNKPLYPIHHLKSHIFSAWINNDSKKTQTKPLFPTFPLLALVISGGHTQIIKMTSETDFKIIGTTLDDAVGECFDKIAKILGLPYPGGPAISAAALGRLPNPKNPGKTLSLPPGSRDLYKFPHPKVEGLNFSFSGLKTAVLRSVQATCNVPISFPSKDLKTLLSPTQIVNYAASFEQTAVDILLEKLALALKENSDTASIVFAGGVSANKLLQNKAREVFGDFWRCAQVTAELKPADPRDGGRAERRRQKPPTPASEPTIYFPELNFSGDNAAMVALAATSEIRHNVPPTDPRSLKILPRSNIF